jgi:hypothetical protein
MLSDGSNTENSHNNKKMRPIKYKYDKESILFSSDVKRMRDNLYIARGKQII